MFKNKKERKNVLIFIGLVGLVLAVLWFVGNIKDESFFKKLPKTVQSYYDDQMSALGVAMPSSGLKKFCYQAEQGPFDNGNRWCAARIQQKIQIKPDNDYVVELLNKFEKKIKEQGFVVINKSINKSSYGSGVSGGIYDHNGGMTCTASLDYLPGTAYPDAKTTMNYELNCSKRSSVIPAGYTYTP